MNQVNAIFSFKWKTQTLVKSTCDEERFDWFYSTILIVFHIESWFTKTTLI